MIEHLRASGENRSTPAFTLFVLVGELKETRWLELDGTIVTWFQRVPSGTVEWAHDQSPEMVQNHSGRFTMLFYRLCPSRNVVAGLGMVGKVHRLE